MWLQRPWGPSPIYKCRLSSVGIPVIKSHGRDIFIMEISITGKTVITLRRYPGVTQRPQWWLDLDNSYVIWILLHNVQVALQSLTHCGLVTYDVIDPDQHWFRSSAVMPCCLVTPSNYLNQCWHTISNVLWHSPKNNVTGNTQWFNPLHEFENYT